MFAGKPIDFTQVQVWEERILKHLENNGYPFAKVYLDSLQLENDKVSALLKINKGPLYRIDSIRVYGTAKISNNYLQHYLDISNGSVYSKEKLLRINKKIRETRTNFNIGITTGIDSDYQNLFFHPYRHWLFIPSSSTLESGDES